MSIGQLLLYSPKCLKRIKNIIATNKSYIVPGFPSNEDILLSEALGGVPIFSGEPQIHLVNSMKSGAKRIFQTLQIPSPPGAYEIYDEKELINTLALLILNYPKVQIWLLKIDDETAGRGIASIDVRKLSKYLRDPKFISQQDAVVQIAALLQKKLPSKIQISYTQLFKNYTEYLQAFTRKGGIIEASPNCHQNQIESPSLFFKINPDGEIQSLGSFDKLKINNYQTIGCSGPKQSLPNINIQYLCQNVGSHLFKLGIFGFVQLDLIAFQQEDNSNYQQIFWAIGLDCYLTSLSSASFYFDFLMKGKTDQLTGSYSVQLNDNDGSKSSNQLIKQNEVQNRSYLYCPIIINQGLQALQYKTFFQLCRLESISFNLEKKVGSTFILIDSLQGGVLSLLTIGDSNNSALKYMNDAFEFLIKNVGKDLDQQDLLDQRTDKIRMMAIIQKIKQNIKNNTSTIEQYNNNKNITNVYL